MNIGELRKADTDRRTSGDRRNLFLPHYPVVDRRCGTERRAKRDRRLSVSVFESGEKPKTSLLGTILKYGLKFGGIKEGALKGAPVSGRTVDRATRIKRAYHRLPCRIPVKIFDGETHRFIPATARNYCQSGMYLESEHAPGIDTGIAIKMDNQSLETAEPEEIPKYHSRVIWRRKISGKTVGMSFGIGVKHCSDLEEFLNLFSL